MIRNADGRLSACSKGAPQYAKAALQSLARRVTIPYRLRLALAYWGDSEVRKIRWNGVPIAGNFAARQKN
jgi:hypothetical protein